MDEYKLARSVSLVSLGVGLSLLVAPTRTTESFGIDEVGRVVSTAHV